MTTQQPTARYEVVYDDLLKVWDVYIEVGNRITGAGGFDTQAQAIAWVERHKKGQP